MPNNVKGDLSDIEEILDEIEDLEDKAVKAGFPAESSGEGSRSMAETALVAAVHEFGSAKQGIPPRPFIRPAVDENADEWLDEFADDLFDGVIEGPANIEWALGRAGIRIKQAIQHKIRDRSSPKLSEEYVENDPIKQDRSNALIRHGWMLQSVNWEIVDS
jgi:hypothetical protein